jgi:hypothetical protein
MSDQSYTQHVPICSSYLRPWEAGQYRTYDACHYRQHERTRATRESLSRLPPALPLPATITGTLPLTAQPVAPIPSVTLPPATTVTALHPLLIQPTQ